jgi:Ca2+-binding RTX toxin-like protein
VIRQGHLIAVVVAFLIGCMVLVVGCFSGVRSGAPQKEDQGYTEATSEATREQREQYGGPTSDFLTGDAGKDILHGGAGSDSLLGGAGDDVLYGDDGDDGGFTNNRLMGGKGEDVIYGGNGRDLIVASDGQRDKIYCGKGKDFYTADKIDYVSSSCEEKTTMGYHA